MKGVDCLAVDKGDDGGKDVAEEGVIEEAEMQDLTIAEEAMAM